MIRSIADRLLLKVVQKIRNRPTMLWIRISIFELEDDVDGDGDVDERDDVEYVDEARETEEDD